MLRGRDGGRGLYRRIRAVAGAVDFEVDGAGERDGAALLHEGVEGPLADGVEYIRPALGSG